jgi:hypothetical protein
LPEFLNKLKKGFMGARRDDFQMVRKRAVAAAVTLGGSASAIPSLHDEEDLP